MKKMLVIVVTFFLFSNILIVGFDARGQDHESKEISKENPVLTSSGYWMDTSWRYRKRLNISNPHPDYQMKINVSYDGGGEISCEGHSNWNFSDIRFTGADGISERAYWIEEKVNGSYAETWVNTSGEDMMYLYYGNPSASYKGNGTDVFLAFHGDIIESFGDHDDSGTLITFNNMSYTNNSRVHYKYFYQGNTNGRPAYIYTIYDGVTIDTNSFTNPYKGDGADKDDVSTYASRDFVETDENITDTVRFDFENGDYKLRIANIGISLYVQPSSSWGEIGEEVDGISVISSDPIHGEESVPIDRDVTLIFSVSLNTSIIPTLNQTGGVDNGGWTFQGWSSTYMDNDTATWSHNDWNTGDHVTLNVSSYEDISGNQGNHTNGILPRFSTTILKLHPSMLQLRG